MKKKPLIIIVLLLIITLQNYAQNTAVPDAEFEQALIDLGLDVDLAVNGQVPTAGIENVTSLDVSGQNISDLTGIEGFAALQILNCSNNNLTALNIDANQDLQQLDCSNNTIGPFINTEFNQDLVVINASNNNLTSFILEFNTILTDFNISNNSGITNLDLSLLGNLASLNLDNMSALEQLNIANSNNEGITTFSAVNTPKLFCTNVSNVAFAEANWTNRDAQNAYSTTCFYDGFITTWKTDNSGNTADDTIGIGTNGAGYNYAINWGDGTIETGITGDAFHTYATPGTYTVQISGAFPGFFANFLDDEALKLLEINQWGNIQWATFEEAFSNAKNMVGNFTDAPDLTNVTNMAGMFGAAESFNSPIANWDVSTITNMANMFIGTKAFNQPLDAWIVSNVTDMSNMFFNADAFNQPLNSWNVSKVANMSEMFANTEVFNQPLNNWNVSNVTDIYNMFKDAKVFNQPLDNWTLTSVTNAIGLLEMFFNAEAFNQSLANWNVSNIKDMTRMLTGTALSTENYDATLIAWDGLPSVQNNVTLGATATYCNSETARTSLQAKGWTINDDGIDNLCGLSPNAFITTWQTTTANENITIPTAGNGYNYTVDWGDGTIENGFTGDATHNYATAGTYTVQISGTFPRINFQLGSQANVEKIIAINQWGNIQWDTFADAFSSCKNMVGTFTDAPDLSNVTNLSGMFSGADAFNHPINNWDVSTITNMSYMFADADTFNQPLNNWVVNNVTNMSNMFHTAKAFNQPLHNWNVSNVTDISEMFQAALVFNQPLNNWNVSNVTNAYGVFRDTKVFNQPLDNWVITSVNNVSGLSDMFLNAEAFNQSLASWDVSNVKDMTRMLTGTALTTENYDATLIAWDALPSVQTNITLGASATYCTSETARTSLQTKGWTFNDGGLDVACVNATDFFISTWQTTTANESITIPTTAGGYNYTVDWGNGIVETSFTGDATHTYVTAGTYTVKISGAFPRIFFNNDTNKDKILSVEQWGTIQWTNMSDAFNGCTNLQVNATDAPDLTQAVNLSRMFKGCTSLNANFNHWDVSTVRFMPAMFEGATSFNGQIGGWITTNLTLASNMFKSATAFNQDISGWNMTNVTAMNGMFFNAEVFNQPIGSWVLIRAFNMRDVFNNAKQFNQPLANWNVSKVTSMFGMFHNADAFNQPIGGWTTDNVTNMTNMFNSADVFNQPLDSWNVSNVNNMFNMFSDADAFNQPLDSWNVSKVLNMNNMFLNADVFNQALGSWDISSVTTMNNMFNNATAFSTASYDATLIGWNALPTLQSSSIVLTTSATYCASATARQNLIDTYGWNIVDAGLDTNCGISFSPIVILQGAAINPNVGEETLMRDDLRVEGLIPTTSPYADAATCDATVFDQTGVDAVVDWVWVELRDATDNTIVVGGKSGLLTRGGFVFDTDGFSNLTFQQLPDNYHVVVKHRNHLGVMTNSSLPLSNASILVNFSDANNPITFGTNAQTDFGMQPDKVAMWAGDVNGDEKIIFSNAGAESIEVKNTVLNDAGNIFNSVFYKPEGYYNADVNMNGEVVFLNSGNELLYVKDNILEHPGNIFGQIFYTITTQLP